MRPVLIGEGHLLVAEATGELLPRFGEDIQTVICSDASEGLAKLDGSVESWFRIFLDLDVPGTYGLSLARGVQRRALLRDAASSARLRIMHTSKRFGAQAF
jgi:CheY-like chemotaxis protein